MQFLLTEWLGLALLGALAAALMPQSLWAVADTPAKAVQGEILRIEDDFYVLKDESGQEIRLHVDDKTDRLDHAVLEIGDSVRAYVTPEGHATSIKHLGPPDRIEEEDVRKPGLVPTR